MGLVLLPTLQGERGLRWQQLVLSVRTLMRTQKKSAEIANSVTDIALARRRLTEW